MDFLLVLGFFVFFSHLFKSNPLGNLKIDSEIELFAATQRCLLGKELQMQCITNILDSFKLSALTLTAD